MNEFISHLTIGQIVAIFVLFMSFIAYVFGIKARWILIGISCVLAPLVINFLSVNG